MNLKNYLSKMLYFLIRRLIEIVGIFFSILGILLLLSLLTYSAEDPNFIYSGNENINNILGYRGSYISDFFFSIYWPNIFFVLSLNFFYRHKYNLQEENYFYFRKFFFYNFILTYREFVFKHLLQLILLVAYKREWRFYWKNII